MKNSRTSVITALFALNFALTGQAKAQTQSNDTIESWFEQIFSIQTGTATGKDPLAKREQLNQIFQFEYDNSMGRSNGSLLATGTATGKDPLPWVIATGTATGKDPLPQLIATGTATGKDPASAASVMPIWLFELLNLSSGSSNGNDSAA